MKRGNFVIFYFWSNEIQLTRDDFICKLLCVNRSETGRYDYMVGHVVAAVKSGTNDSNHMKIMTLNFGDSLEGTIKLENKLKNTPKT